MVFICQLITGGHHFIYIYLYLVKGGYKPTYNLGGTTLQISGCTRTQVVNRYIIGLWCSSICWQFHFPKQIPEVWWWSPRTCFCIGLSTSISALWRTRAPRKCWAKWHFCQWIFPRLRTLLGDLGVQFHNVGPPFDSVQLGQITTITRVCGSYNYS